MLLLLPWEPPSIWRALTNRRCKSGDQHLLAFLWVLLLLLLLFVGLLEFVCPSVELPATPFTCSWSTAPPLQLLILLLLLWLPRFSLLPFSFSEHLLSWWSISLSGEARARSGRARKVGLGQEFRSFENGTKAPPFLCLVSKASLGLITLNPTISVVVSLGDAAIVFCDFVSLLPVWLHSWAVVIQFALSEIFWDLVSEISELEFFRGMNSSRTGLGPWFVAL